MVDANADPAAAAAGRPPVGSEIVPYAPGEGNGAPFEVLRREVMINGEQLIDAQQSFDPQSNMPRSEEHTSELQSLMRISYAVFCLKKKIKKQCKEKRTSIHKNISK